MNQLLAVITGVLVFGLVQVLKGPIKKGICKYVAKRDTEVSKRELLRKRLGCSLAIVAFLLAIILDIVLTLAIGRGHVQLCYGLKAGAVSVFIYVIYEQWFRKIDR